MKGIVREINIDTARPFITKWHYSERVPTGKNIFFGWYIDAPENTNADIFGETLYAVANYGIGVNPYQARSLSSLVGKDIARSKLLELKRLCRIEPRLDEFPLTSFIAKCHRLLKPKGYRYIVSFSDPAYGHTGGIYKAANFVHLGKTNAENHAVGEDGIVRHRRFYYRYARRNNISVVEARKELGLKLVKTVPKDRWFIEIH